MSELTLKVRSSDGVGLYTVTARRVDGLVRISCDCPAGAHNRQCRHRFELIMGDTKGCVGATNDKLLAFRLMVDQSPLREMAGEVVELGREAERIARRIKTLKNIMARVMYSGR